MRSGGPLPFVLGVVLGAVGGGLGVHFLQPTPAASVLVPERPPPPHDDAPAPPLEGKEVCDVPPPRLLAPAPAPDRPLPPEDRAAFPEGVVVLRIGDAYVFGASRVAEASEAAAADLLCEDIRAGATLACPHGALPADVPLGAVGLPERPAEAAILLVDAPRDLPQRHAFVGPRVSATHPGLVLVRSAAGVTYKLWLLEERNDPNALRRAVRLGYAPVPVAEGGGLLRTATASPLDTDAGPTNATLARLVVEARAIPGDSFASFLGGSYERLPAPKEDLKVTADRRLVLDGTLRTRLEVPGGAIFATDGIAATGRIVTTGYTGLVVDEDMAGHLDIGSYAYVHLLGDLVGDVDLRSYATIVIDGDLVGTLRTRSYVTLLLRGRLLGKLDPDGACWSTFYLQGWWSRERLAALPADASVTLHVEQSDAPQGKLEPTPGGWREVIVGDPVWAKLRK